jgi:lipoprotein-anchoring transpeptidase ErfK/SrfK
MHAMRMTGLLLTVMLSLLLAGFGGVVRAQESGLLPENLLTEPRVSGPGVVMRFTDLKTASGSKAIHIFLGKQTAFLTQSGFVLKTYQISTGKSETPTPRGEFLIHKKQELRISSQGVPYRMPRYMSFTPNSAYGLHALPYLGNKKEDSWYWQEALEHIGTPVSHGCIRFLPDEVEEIYEWADVGTPVIIHS